MTERCPGTRIGRQERRTVSVIGNLKGGRFDRSYSWAFLGLPPRIVSKGNEDRDWKVVSTTEEGGNRGKIFSQRLVIEHKTYG